MARLTVLTFPDKRLRKKAQPVTVFDAALKTTVADMLETMYAESGVGLAATQVHIQQRIIVIDVSESRDIPLVLINPEVTCKTGEVVWQEGCLSVPEYYAEVQRAATVSVTAQDVDGVRFSREADGLLSVCLQHEIDHLNGKLFIDYLPKDTRDMLKAKYRFH